VFREHLQRRIAGVKEESEAAKTEASRQRVRREVWEDTVWALLNSKEFLFNH
jgi:hypothetical protein